MNQQPIRRSDITGLRAIAVTIVVAFHASLSFFRGGLDMFFVISGFLITGLIITEIEFAGKFGFKNFMARRIRRIIPAASVAVIFTVLFMFLLVPGLQWLGGAMVGFSTLLYSANIFFAYIGGDYFASEWLNSNPLLHTWSLGLEMQFSIFIAMVSALVTWINIPNPKKTAPAFLYTLIGLSCTSFVLSIIFNVHETSAAYFGLHTRFWEFGVGGLAFLLSRKFIFKPFKAFLIRAFGLLLVVSGAMITFNSTSSDGRLLLLTVFGSSIILLANQGFGGPISDKPDLIARVLGSKPFQFVGNLSYSLYLYHWPVLIFISLLVGSQTQLLVAPIGIVVSVLLAWLSERFVERPFRINKELKASARKSFRVGAVFTATALLFVTSLFVAAKIWESNAKVKGLDSFSEIIGGIRYNELDYEIVGDQESAMKVLVVGDSHAKQWVDGFNKAGKEKGIGVEVLSMAGCTPFELNTLANFGLKNPNCTKLREKFWELAESGNYAAVVVSVSDGYLRENKIVAADGGQVDSDTQIELWKVAYESFMTRLSGTVQNIGMVDDNPTFASNPEDCLISATSVGECDVQLEKALAQNAELKKITKLVWADYSSDIAAIFDPTSLLCPNRICRLSEAGQSVMNDDSHFNKFWVEEQSPAIGKFISELVGEEISSK